MDYTTWLWLGMVLSTVLIVVGIIGGIAQSEADHQRKLEEIRQRGADERAAIARRYIDSLGRDKS